MRLQIMRSGFAAAVVGTLFAAACSSPAAPVGPVKPVDNGSACESRALATQEQDFFEASTGSRGLHLPPPADAPAGFQRMGVYDVNGDGFDDVVMHTWYPTLKEGSPYQHRVFVNDGKGNFSDKAEEMGLRYVQAGTFAFADVDNDGDPDCVAALDIDIRDPKYEKVTQLAGATNQVLLNDGKGRFAQLPNSGIEGALYTDAIVFGDYNNDGKVDVFLGNGHTSFAQKDNLYFGLGDGTFSQESTRLSAAVAQPTNGAVACDYDNDGDLDIFVSTYGVSSRKGWNHLWENDGAGNFVNVANDRGFAALGTGTYWSEAAGKGRAIQEPDASKWVGSNGFGIDCADVSGDGKLDIWQVTISHGDGADFGRLWSDPTALFVQNKDDNGFANEFLDRGISYNEGDIDGAIGDYDNDGRADLFVSRTAKYEGNYSTPEQQGFFGLFRQSPGGGFSSVGLASGINDMTAATKRGKETGNIALFDMDHDGDLDLLMSNSIAVDKQGQLMENKLGNQNAWLSLRVRGDGAKVHRDAFGTRATIKIGDKVVVREKKSSRGTYSSGDSATLAFGLGDLGACKDAKNQATLEVRWPDGTLDNFDASKFSLRRHYLLDYGKKALVEVP